VAIIKNDTIALMKSPIRNLLPFNTKAIPEKSGAWTMAAISGGEEVFYERSYYCTESGPNNNSHRHVNYIATQQKLFESFHKIFSLRLARVAKLLPDLPSSFAAIESALRFCPCPTPLRGKRHRRSRGLIICIRDQLEAALFGR
jgi:hypothetical protein